MSERLRLTVSSASVTRCTSACAFLSLSRQACSCSARSSSSVLGFCAPAAAAGCAPPAAGEAAVAGADSPGAVFTVPRPVPVLPRRRSSSVMTLPLGFCVLRFSRSRAANSAMLCAPANVGNISTATSASVCVPFTSARDRDAAAAGLLLQVRDRLLRLDDVLVRLVDDPLQSRAPVAERGVAQVVHLGLRLVRRLARLDDEVAPLLDLRFDLRALFGAHLIVALGRGSGRGGRGGGGGRGRLGSGSVHFRGAVSLAAVGAEVRVGDHLGLSGAGLV